MTCYVRRNYYITKRTDTYLVLYQEINLADAIVVKDPRLYLTNLVHGMREACLHMARPEISDHQLRKIPGC